MANRHIVILDIFLDTDHDVFIYLGPVGNHDKLAGARLATAVHQKTITGGGKNTVMDGSDLSLNGADQEVTNGAGERKIQEQVPRQQKQ